MPLLGITITHFLCPHTATAIVECMARIRRVGPRGGYYEFGLFTGNTFRMAFRAADLLGGMDWMRFYGFDSFQGLPPLEGVDVGTAEFKAGQFACDRVVMEQNLVESGVDMSRVELIEGFYCDSLIPELTWGMQPVALALIDCDLYISASQALTFLGGLMREGSIIMFDEWNAFDRSDEHGERRAFREFLAQHPELWAESHIDFGGHGQSFIMHEEAS